MEDFKKLFNSFTSLKVGVIGDVMLDTYMWGKVDRISPEAPVPVVSLNNKEYRIGGAGNLQTQTRPFLKPLRDGLDFLEFCRARNSDARFKCDIL